MIKQEKSKITIMLASWIFEGNEFFYKATVGFHFEEISGRRRVGSEEVY